MLGPSGGRQRQGRWQAGPIHPPLLSLIVGMFRRALSPPSKPPFTSNSQQRLVWAAESQADSTVSITRCSSPEPC